MATESETRSLVNAMVSLANNEPPFNIICKVLISDFRTFKMSVSVEGNQRLKSQLHAIYACPPSHGDYFHSMKDIREECLSICDTVRNLAKEPGLLPDDKRARLPEESALTYDEFVPTLPDEQFAFWFTVEFDQNHALKPKFQTSPLCSENVNRVLTQGSVDMSKAWDVMKDLVLYIYFSAFFVDAFQNAKSENGEPRAKKAKRQRFSNELDASEDRGLKETKEPINNALEDANDRASKDRGLEKSIQAEREAFNLKAEKKRLYRDSRILMYR